MSTDGQTHTRTDAKRFYYLSHAICYSYGADNNNQIVILASGVDYVGGRTCDGRAQAAVADGRTTGADRLQAGLGGVGGGGQAKITTSGAWLTGADG